MHVGNTFSGYQVLGFMTLIQDDQTVSCLVPASQPLDHLEKPSARMNTLGSGIRQIRAGPIASVNVLIICCLKSCFLEGSNEETVCDEHDTAWIVLVQAAFG